MNKELEAQIESIFRRIMFPTPMMRWMEGLTGAERAGRIKRAKMSVLRYGIQRYVWSQLPEIDKRFRLDVEPFDDEIKIGGRDPQQTQDNWTMTIPYPLWLQDFLDDDDRFNFMLPANETKLQDVLQAIFEYCREHEDYRFLVE